MLNEFVLHNQNKTRNLCHFDLFQRPSSDELVLGFSDLDMITSHHVKKAVVHVAELIAALIPIHGLLTFLMECLITANGTVLEQVSQYINY